MISSLQCALRLNSDLHLGAGYCGHHALKYLLTGTAELHHDLDAGMCPYLSGTVVDLRCRAGVAHVFTPMYVARAHLNPLPILGFDEPSTSQHDYPLQSWARMPFSDPANRHDVEPNCLYIALKLTHPEWICIAAYTLADEIRQFLSLNSRLAIGVWLHMPEGQRGRSLRIARIRLHFIQLVFHACLSCDERIQNSTSERIITTNVKRFVQSHRSRVQRVRLACQRYFAKDK
ncbi:hypothetical protein SAMN05216320_105340 [Duganella sp. OV458]|nr:hypothetical protein SAMN05216320_105340 [Duganella sp. OV458]SDJ83074.1 hypothetical protein SAMN05428973_106341 [Duganella sp. OV510]